MTFEDLKKALRVADVRAHMKAVLDIASAYFGPERDEAVNVAAEALEKQIENQLKPHLEEEEK